MSNLRTLALQTLGENSVEFLGIESLISGYTVNQFLKNFESLKDSNKSDEKVLDLLRCAVISQSRPLVKSGQYLCQKSLKYSTVLSTGCQQLNALLNGGIYTNEVVEVYGPAGKGKTQFALSCSVVACFKHRCNVVYIDTSCCFSANRFMEISINKGATEQVSRRLLKKVMVVPCHDVFQLHEAIDNISKSKKAKSTGPCGNLKLLVIDSIFSLLSPILGYGTSEGYAVSDSLALALRKLARESYVAVLVINGTVTREISQGIPKPALGIQWQQTADKRLLIQGFNSESNPQFKVQLITSKQ